MSHSNILCCLRHQEGLQGNSVTAIKGEEPLVVRGKKQ